MLPTYLAGIPMGRLGEPEEVAKVVLFLASEDSNYITGENIVVAGDMPFSSEKTNIMVMVAPSEADCVKQLQKITRNFIH